LHAFAGEHRRHREQPLAAGARSFVVVEEFERTFAQLEDRDVRRRAAITSGMRIPLSSRMPFLPGAYMWVTMSPRLSSAR
jgi:hypothetical protein